MNKTLHAAMALVIGSTLSACATDSQPPSASGSPHVERAVVALETLSMTAKVEAVDQAKRLVTLRGPQGRVVKAKVDPSVQNLANVKVGDTVAVQYREAVALEVVRGGGAPSASAEVLAASAAPGEKPAGVVADRVRITAKVVSVDTAKRRIRIREPNGQVQSFAVHNQNILRDLKAGDDIEVVYTEALAVVVEPAKTAKKK